MGIDLAGFPQRRDRLFEGREEDDRERRRGEFGMGPSIFGTRGPRERAEEDLRADRGVEGPACGTRCRG